MADEFGRDEVYLKIVVRRTDKSLSKGTSSYAKPGSTNAIMEQRKLDATVMITVTKAECLIDAAAKIKKRPPRTNVLGEAIVSKGSSLRNREESKSPTREERKDPPKTILRKLSVDANAYSLCSPGSSKYEACVFYPKVPRAWMGANGLIVVPSLSEKGVKGTFDIDVFCSERFLMSALPESYSRTIAGDWTESTSGGNHLNSTWMKNPKYLLKFRNPVNTDEPARVRITLARHGPDWKAQAKKDTVGAMIGFYIFVVRDGEYHKYYESTYVPENELATDSTFALEQLPHGEKYAIMPTTFGDGKVGAFVLSVLSEYEFSIVKEA